MTPGRRTSVKRILTVFGTRPEAIKLAPVIRALASSEQFEPIVCVTGQHRQMLDQVLDVFGIETDFDLDLMQPNQDLSDITAAVTLGIRDVFEAAKPDLALVQGDTTTAMAAALGSFYARVPVGHVEAGLRTGDKANPFPEEINRSLIGRIADLHFAPTVGARLALLSEGVLDRTISVTGNTVVDALFWARDIIEEGSSRAVDQIGMSLPGEVRELMTSQSSRVVLVTGHRRESFGPAFEQICLAIKEISERSDDVHVIYPVHMNPSVQEPVYRILSDSPGVHLIEPVPFLAFVWLMKNCHLILTDSGGVQEEAPSLGKPVLILRNVTERPEGVEAGCARLVGTDARAIVDGTALLLDHQEEYDRMSRVVNPYGDGTAAINILNVIEEYMIRND